MITRDDWNSILEDIGIQYLVGVPSSELGTLYENEVCKNIICSREDEALGMATGINLAGSNVIVAIQSSGLGNIFNALGSLYIPYQIKFPLLISIRGGVDEENEVQKLMGNSSEELLRTIGIKLSKPKNLHELHNEINHKINEQSAILINKKILK